MLKSGDLMLFFHVYLLKSQKYNPTKYCLAKIMKLSTDKVLVTIIYNLISWGKE